MIRRAFGGNTTATGVLVAVNVVIFIVQMNVSPETRAAWIAWFGLSREGLEAGRFWQPVTHMFLHGNLLHILVNMLVLWASGREVERTYGIARFLTVYFLGGILGGLLQVWLVPGGGLIGASGGVCAVLLAFTTTYPEMPITALLFFVLPINIRAKYLGYGVILISVVFYALNIERGIGHMAHLGGALTGLVFARLGRRHLTAPPPVFPANPPPPPQPGRGLFHRKVSNEDLDQILEKVMKHGIHSLSASERRTLETWSRRRSQ